MIALLRLPYLQTKAISVVLNYSDPCGGVPKWICGGALQRTPCLVSGLDQRGNGFCWATSLMKNSDLDPSHHFLWCIQFIWANQYSPQTRNQQLFRRYEFKSDLLCFKTKPSPFYDFNPKEK